MDETTRSENKTNEPTDKRQIELESPSSAATPKNRDRRQLLDTIESDLFAILKICLLAFVLISFVLIFVNIYTEQGIVILPFEVGNNENFSGAAIADQLTCELIRIQKIHNINYEEINIIIPSSSISYRQKISSEDSLVDQGIVVAKGETLEFSMADIGTVGIGSNSLSLGSIIIAFKNILPASKTVSTIRGSLQRYGSTIVLVAVLEGDDVQSWKVRQTINNEEQLLEMVKNLAFNIVYDMPQSNVSAKTWEGFKYYTESLDAYHQYTLTGNSDYLYLAGNYSFFALNSEKEYENPFNLLSLLETSMLSIGRQNDAIEYCNKTLELDNTSAYAWNNKAIVLIILDKYEEAIQACDEAIRLNPEFKTAWVGRGVALKKLGKYEEAIQAYNEAIRLDPKVTAAWNNKGSALVSLSKYKEAIQAYDEAIRLDPEFKTAWVGKGTALNNLGRNTEADAAFAKAKELG